MRCDQKIRDAVEQVAEGSQTIDIAIHNACKCTFCREKDADLTVYQDVFDVNYYGALRLAKCVLYQRKT